MTKASERFFEINYAVEYSKRRSRPGPIWFSPSQVQEHLVGFDTMFVGASGVEMIQFKVPKRRLVRPPSKRYLRPKYEPDEVCLRVEIPHHQVKALNLQVQRSTHLRAHFVFPNVVGIAEYFDGGFGVVKRSFSLDMMALGALGPPHRASGAHLGDFYPNRSEIVLHSDIVFVPAIPISDWSPPSDEPMDERAACEVAAIVGELASALPLAHVVVHGLQEERLQ